MGLKRSFHLKTLLNIALSISLSSSKEKLDLEKTALYAKQTRHSRFLSQGERNNWLNTEISKFQTLVAETTRSASAIRTEISTGKEKVALNAKQRGDKETRVATMREEMSDMEKRERQVREERMTFDEKRK